MPHSRSSIVRNLSVLLETALRCYLWHDADRNLQATIGPARDPLIVFLRWAAYVRCVQRSFVMAMMVYAECDSVV